MNATLISESIHVNAEDLEPTIAIGQPGAPRKFTWRGEEVSVKRVVNQWRETRGCTHGSGEQYAYKHWFELDAGDGRRMKIYFERKARSKAQAKRRWWLYTVESPAETG